jgi:two-component system, OmpR family, KDP operon response regulator KdpE
MDSVLIVGARLCADRRFRMSLSEEFTVTEGREGLESLRSLIVTKPHAVVLDASHRLSEVLDLIKVMRAACDVAIIVLRDEEDRHFSTRILEAGADDCLPASVDSSEFLARLRSTIRRSKQQRQVEAGECVRTGALTVNRETREVYLNEARVSLTPTEFRLLEALSENVGRPVPHRVLLATVWGPEYIGDSHYLRIYVGYLRQKLEQDPRAPRYLLNEWGVGYRLAALPAQVDLRTEVVRQDDRVLVGAPA